LGFSGFDVVHSNSANWKQTCMQLYEQVVGAILPTVPQSTSSSLLITGSRIDGAGEQLSYRSILS
jgi:hypothetical protein